MKKITRRILFCTCVVLFLTISPLVILYAFGFRYDFTKKKLIQTGIIYLTPNIQDKIKILINDREEPNKISIKGIFKKEFVLENLMPKIYNIKIDKENYHTWEKNLVVMPGITTYAQPLLLPSNPKINLIFNDVNIPIWSISNTFRKIFYLKSSNEKISANTYDFYKKITNTKIIEIPPTQSNDINNIIQNSKIFLAPNGEKFSFILSQENTRIILLNSIEKNISTIADFISNDKIIDASWDVSSQYFLYLNGKGDLNLYDTVAKKSKKILDNILGFSLNNEDIYYLDKNNSFFYRSMINKPTKKQQLSYAPIIITQKNNKIEKNETINPEEKIEIIVSSKNTLAAITPQKNLFIIDQNGSPVNIGNNIESAIFSQGGDNILFNSSFEIFTYNLENKQENLITRLFQKVSNVNWYSDYTHIWFLSNQIIKNIELDSRPTPNIVDFLNMAKQPDNVIYTDTNSIYYDQVNDNNLSIYQAEIQKP